MRRPIALLAALMVVLVAAGCAGTDPVAEPGEADLENGQKLFVASCGGCHILENAGTKGTVGPDLDAAYAGPAVEGWDRSSFEALVREQIKVGAVDSVPPMPAELLTGDDARDVAAYVAAVAAENVEQ